MSSFAPVHIGGDPFIVPFGVLSGPQPGLAPVVENTSIGLASTASGSVTTDQPAGTTSSNAVLFAHGSDDGSTPVTLTPPAGAVSIDERRSPGGGNGTVSEVSSLEAGASEPATYTAFTSASEKQVLIALRISGVNPADIVDVAASADSSTGFPVSPAVTTTVDNCRIFRITSFDYQTGSFVEDTGYPTNAPEHYYLRASGPAQLNSNTILGAASGEQAAAGDTGIATWNPVGLTGPINWVAFTVAVKPGSPLGPSASGDAVSQSATGTGTAYVAHKASGDAQSQSATSSGTAAIKTPPVASGDAVSQPATSAGTAYVIHNASGDAQSQPASSTGSAKIKEVPKASGDAVSQSATSSGTAYVKHYASGDAVSGAATSACIAITGDGWTPANTGQKETWVPVDTGKY